MVLYLMVLALCNMPAVQQWGAQRVSRLLEDKLQSRVAIQRLRMGLFNRIVLEGILVWDRSDSLMLDVSQLSAKVDVLALTESKIHIHNAQVLGLHAHLYQRDAQSAPNFGYVLQAFASTDTTSSPLHLQLGHLVVRRANVSFHRHYIPHEPHRLSPHHLDVANLSLSATLHHLTPDSIDVQLRQCSFAEQSGLSLQGLQCRFRAGGHGARLDELELTLPHSRLNIPQLTARYPTLPQGWPTHSWFSQFSLEGDIEARITPADVTALLPQLRHAQAPLALQARLTAEQGQLKAHHLTLADEDGHLQLNMEAAMHLASSPTRAHATIQRLWLGPQFQAFATRQALGQERQLSPLLTRLQAVELQGEAHLTGNNLQVEAGIHTHLGHIRLEGEMEKGNDIHATIDTERFQLGELLGAKPTMGEASMRLHTQGQMRAHDGRPALDAKALIRHLDVRGHRYQHIDLEAHCAATGYTVELGVEDSLAQIQLQATLDLLPHHKQLSCQLQATEIDLHRLHLTPKMQGERASLCLDAHLAGSRWTDLEGEVDLTEMSLHSDSLGLLSPADLSLQIGLQEGERVIHLASQQLNGYVRGKFQWRNLAPVLGQIASTYLPSVFVTHDTTTPDHIAFHLQVQDTALVRRLAGIQLHLPQPATLQGRMSGQHGTLQLSAEIPHLRLGGETLQNVALSLQSMPEILQTSASMHRIMKEKPVKIDLNAYMGYDKVRATLLWDNHRTPARQSGEVNATGIFFKGRDGKMALHTRLANSSITLSDSLWTLHPAMIEWHDGVVDVHNLGLNQGTRYLSASGRLGRGEEDSLMVQLQGVNLEYIFKLIRFNAVDFAGNATGHIYAKHLLSQPVAKAYLNVDSFMFNQGYMGSMDVQGSWGERGQSIWLNARMTDPQAAHQTHVQGTITPGRGEKGGLDLSVNTQRINLYFLNRFTSGIFHNLQGRASGWARIFGPFKRINLEGDLRMDQVEMDVKALGTRYHLMGDSIRLRPDNIWIDHATVYDPQGNPSTPGHSATIQCHLMHDCLKRLRYQVDVEAHNILGYHRPQFGDASFCGTAYATGQVHIEGRPRYLQVDVAAAPEQGTTFRYNVSTPETLTKAHFITYVQPSDTLAQHTTLSARPDTQPAEEEGELHLNFDFDLNPQAEVRLQMDAKAGDEIVLYGHGRIRAHHYNKGKFRMYGIYHVERGTYQISLQDFIRKDFTFQPTSTLTFGGDAMGAALNLQAIHTVPNVSLDDLSSTSLGLSNTRVDCVMNIGGTPAGPQVTFDFDLPNANEDEKQMVRSMVNTEEEKNMQAIHLLGIGRFYNSTIRYTQGGGQSTTAVNSLLSSTLSNQFSHLMNHMVGSRNWSFGANLRTGETGWRDLDVEGILSGRFLNNRLLFNGNFGYRESIYSNNNFIGDFDVQYLLTPTGTISLKAYNQTNDRYFIQSSLTTQGIGIQLKKDFNRWRDIFRRKRKKEE